MVSVQKRFSSPENCQFRCVRVACAETMKKTDLLYDDIAKKFELPERQSKIAFLLKQETNETVDGEQYCICRSSDTTRFMIGCDNCEEWYHGDCINITEREAANIVNFYCIRCQMEDSGLETQWKSGSRSTAPDGDNDFELTPPRDTRTQPGYAATSVSSGAVSLATAAAAAAAAASGTSYASSDKKRKTAPKRCGYCAGCSMSENCGRCDNCKYLKKHGSSGRLKVKCKKRVCLKMLQNSKPQISKSKHRKHDADQEYAVSYAHLYVNEPRQCYGPTCANSARQGSKYCSDECGMKLASVRLFQILPQRLQEWSLSPCVADQKNQEQLYTIRQQQIKVQESLYELEQKRNKLDDVIRHAMSLEIDPNFTDEHAEDDHYHGGGGGGGGSTEMTSFYCVTCGHEIHARTAIKHMERCFNKYESQSSFGSVFKSKIEGSAIFCDFYNASNETYCKRLKVLCPEHTKDKKIADNQVCGCPLIKDLFQETDDAGHCRAPKKSCNKHLAWEKLRKAELDMQCVREWLKLDELVEQERQINQQMVNRGGVLGLLLHSTYNHKAMEKLAHKKN